jgi:Uma2 family endonuclease
VAAVSKFAGDLSKTYTYKDYQTWPDTPQMELIEGVPHAMTPSPSRLHQKIVVELIRQISTYLQGKECEVYPAPFDVRLAEPDTSDEAVYNVVQPDISVICDPAKLDDKGCKGAPDLVMEIVSPSTVTIDYIKKLSLYERYSVREYWIIHPIDKIIMVYKLTEQGSYGRPDTYPIEDNIQVGIFDDLTISLAAIFKI